MLFKSCLLAAGFATASLAATVPTSASYVANYDEFTTDILGNGPTLPNPYLDLVPKSFLVVSRAKNVAIGGLAPQSGNNFIFTNVLFPQPASFHVASPYNKGTFQSFYFGFAADIPNEGAADVAAPGTLTVQGYDKTNVPVEGATFSVGFQPPSDTLSPVPLTKATFPATFPSVYNITFTFTPELTNALLIDAFSYIVSE